MSVQYTGDNVYATYGDGTPVSMILNLTFKELLPIYEKIMMILMMSGSEENNL